MYAYALEETVPAAAAAARGRQEAAGRARPHAEDRPKVDATVIWVTVSLSNRC